MNEKSYSVYMLRAKDGRVYIGMTGQLLYKRCRSTAYNGCPALKKVIDEQGWSFFKPFCVRGLRNQKPKQWKKSSLLSTTALTRKKVLMWLLAGTYREDILNKPYSECRKVKKGECFRKNIEANCANRKGMVA